MLTPSDIAAAKLLVQMADVDVDTARAGLRQVQADPTPEVDLVARLAHAGHLSQVKHKRIRQYVALFEYVRYEAVYLRALERMGRTDSETVSELIAQIEYGSYRRRLGDVLVERGLISAEEAELLDRETRLALYQEDLKVLDRYRRSDFEGVSRPLIPRSHVDLSVFRISELFRSRETNVRVSKHMLRMALEAHDAEEAGVEEAVQAEEQGVENELDVQTLGVPTPGPVGETTIDDAFGSSRFRRAREKGEPNAEFENVEMIGDYAIVEILGQGGMGAVYLAREEGMGPMVAIKVMHSKLASPDDLARFDREATICSLLEHDNVVHLIERGVTDEALNYLVIPFYAGKTLKALLKEEGALEPTLAFHIFEQLLAGAAAIHAAGVVHRDFKPENVFLLAGQPPQVRIVDMGIARVMDDDLPEEQRAFRSLPGVVSGSPAYIAPESITNDPIDGRTDIYSLGILFFQMLTGKLPLKAPTAYEYLREHLMGIPLSLREARRDVSWAPELERLVAGMLAKELLDRPRSCAEILEGLRCGLRDKALEQLAKPLRTDKEREQAPTGLFNNFFKMLGGGGS